MMIIYMIEGSLLFDDSHSGAPPACGFGVLAPDLEPPEVPQAFVTPDFFHSFEVLPHFGVVVVADELERVAIFEVPLSVQKPLGDPVAQRVGHDVLKSLTLFLAQLSRSDVRVHSRDLANQVRKSSPDALYHSQTITYLSLSVDVCVEYT